MKLTTIFIAVLLQFSYSSCKRRRSRTTESSIFSEHIPDESNEELNKVQYSYKIKPDDVKFYNYGFNADINNWTETITELHNNTESLNAVKLIPAAPYKFFIHGFTKDRLTAFPVNVISSYKFRIYELLKSKNETKRHFEIPYPKNYNLISIDWSAISGNWEPPATTIWKKIVNALKTGTSYIGTVYKVQAVSQEIADFIEFLMLHKKIHTLQDVHIIGFSLGAQIASKVGVILQQKNLPGKSLGRITGLDPALPLYTPSNSLSKKDASFVDVIHSCGMGAGIFWNSGHMDIYPCKGKYRNGWAERCKQSNDSASCAHNIAHQLYTLSILGYKHMNFPVANQTEFRVLWKDVISDDAVLFGEFAKLSNTTGSETYCYTDDSIPSTDLIDYLINIEKCIGLEEISPLECFLRYEKEYEGFIKLNYL